jgi:NAD(P)-dependent dehydrogenase (short-subunit alcohol dehydrogenase family)
MMDYRLEGKIALITGTASQKGMARSISLMLAKEGCNIISTDINLEGAELTAALVRDLDRKAIALEADVSDNTQVKEMVKTALAEFSRIDILVNAAGMAIMGVTSFAEADPESWEKEMAVNLYGTMNCCQAIVPGMVERKYGKVINFSSIGAKLGSTSGYGPAKAGITSFTRALASSVGPSGINVNAVAPGVVDTAFFGSNGLSDDMLKGIIASIPMRRIQTVEDVAHVVTFLASDISRNIAGQTIFIDGGMLTL